MNYLNLLLAIIILYVVYLILVENNAENIETFDDSNDQQINILDNLNIKNMKKVVSDFIKPKSNNKTNINKVFLNMQFHNDYKDVVSSFRKITPIDKKIFNSKNLHVKYSDANINEVKDMVNQFINELNTNIAHNFSQYRNINNGWSEPLPNEKMISGWETHQKQLGLKTLYNEPAKNGNIKLVHIDKVSKFETNMETKYDCSIVLQKTDVDDQMKVKISFINLYDSDNVIIESINIEGFLSYVGHDINNCYNNNKNLHYNFNHKKHSMKQKQVEEQLIEHYTKMNNTIKENNSKYDEETRAFKNELPHQTDYQSYKNTQTIIDDYNDEIKWT